MPSTRNTTQDPASSHGVPATGRAPPLRGSRAAWPELLEGARDGIQGSGEAQDLGMLESGLSEQVPHRHVHLLCSCQKAHSHAVPGAASTQPQCLQSDVYNRQARFAREFF